MQRQLSMFQPDLHLQIRFLKSSVRMDSNDSEELLTFTFQLKDIFFFELSTAYDTLFRWPYKSICTSLAGNVRTGFGNYKICKKNPHQVEAVVDSRNIRTLFERCFLHDGHIGSGTSIFTFDSFSAGVDSSERLEDEYNVNLTGIRVFKL